MNSSFTRTNSGLMNEHLFYGVDAVAYLEGGDKAFSFEEIVTENKFHSETLDVIFWQNIFNKYRPDIVIKYKSIGSKLVVLKVCEMIINYDLNTTYACMDNEFDELLSRRFDHRNIFYTYGYSWENEVWTSRTIVSTINRVTATPVNDAKISECYNKFHTNIEVGVRADYYLFSTGSSYFERTKGKLYYIIDGIDGSKLPDVKVEALSQRLLEKGVDEDIVQGIVLSSNKYCYGHLLADFAVVLIKNYIKLEHKLSFKPTNELLNRMILQTHFDNFDDSADYHEHYIAQFNRTA